MKLCSEVYELGFVKLVYFFCSFGYVSGVFVALNREDEIMARLKGFQC